ncbi:MAG: hypothetical protein ABIL69_06590 [candidate division WOR-3 bacterium]
MIIFCLLNIFENFLFPDCALNNPKFNPADFIEPKVFISFGGDEKFGINELHTWNADLQIRPFRLRLKTLGNELYRENALELSGGFLIYKTLTGGISIGLLNNWIKEYTNRFTYTIKLGSVYYLSNFKFDFCLNNINYPKFSEVDYLPVTYVFGSNYFLNKEFKPYFYIMGKEKEKPFLKPGLFIMPVKNFECFTGLSTENFLFEFGLRIHLGRIILDYAGTSHRQLGLSHSFFVNFF